VLVLELTRNVFLRTVRRGVLEWKHGVFGVVDRSIVRSAEFHSGGGRKAHPIN
jgi:hypothetical protein